jgi:hypothetical protein
MVTTNEKSWQPDRRLHDEQKGQGGEVKGRGRKRCAGEGREEQPFDVSQGWVPFDCKNEQNPPQPFPSGPANIHLFKSPPPTISTTPNTLFYANLQSSAH